MLSNAAFPDKKLHAEPKTRATLTTRKGQGGRHRETGLFMAMCNSSEIGLHWMLVFPQW